MKPERVVDFPLEAVDGRKKVRSRKQQTVLVEVERLRYRRSVASYFTGQNTEKYDEKTLSELWRMLREVETEIDSLLKRKDKET